MNSSCSPIHVWMCKECELIIKAAAPAWVYNYILCKHMQCHDIWVEVTMWRCYGGNSTLNCHISRIHNIHYTCTMYTYSVHVYMLYTHIVICTLCTCTYILYMTFYTLFHESTTYVLSCVTCRSKVNHMTRPYMFKFEHVYVD